LRLTLLNAAYGGRRSGPRVFYVDAFSQFMGRSNSEGLANAFAAAGPTRAFDFRREARRLGPAGMNERLVAEATRFKPDLILLVMAESVTVEALTRVRGATNARIVYFYPDLRERPPEFVGALGSVADLVCFPWEDPAFTSDWLGRDFTAAFWRPGVDSKVFKPVPSLRRFDLLFLGNNAAPPIPGAQERRDFIRALSKSGWSLTLFGEGWEHLAGPCVTVAPFVNGVAFSRACSQARVCIGFGSDRVRRYTSWARPFRTMASGAFFLTRRFPGIDIDFEKGRHLDWFRTTEEAIGLIEQHLRNEEGARNIANEGSALVRTRHTWDARRDELFKLARGSK